MTCDDLRKISDDAIFCQVAVIAVMAEGGTFSGDLRMQMLQMMDCMSHLVKWQFSEGKADGF